MHSCISSPLPRWTTSSWPRTCDDSGSGRSLAWGAHLERLHQHVRSFAKIIAQRFRGLPEAMNAYQALPRRPTIKVTDTLELAVRRRENDIGPWSFLS